MKIKKYRLKYSPEDVKFIDKKMHETLDRGYLTDGGPNIDEFEEKWSKFNNSKYSIAVSNCTTALECVLKAIEVKGKSVIVPAYTFVASPMSIHNCGGTPIFADIDMSTLSLSLNSIKKCVQKDTVAVMIVHVGGVVTHEIQKIKDWCDKEGLYLIEDAACAHGSEFNNKKVGNFGIAGCFSFHHSKVLTSGEGGIITTNDADLAKKVKRIRGIGLDRSVNNYQAFEAGSNSKMSEITAILAILHTDKADSIIGERRSIAKEYDDRIKFSKDIFKFAQPKKSKSSYYKYYIRFSDSETRKSMMAFLDSKGIDLPPLTYSVTCDKQKISKKLNWKTPYPLDNTHYMTKHHLCLPMYNSLKKQEIDYIIDQVNIFIEKRNGNNF